MQQMPCAVATAVQSGLPQFAPAKSPQGVACAMPASMPTAYPVPQGNQGSVSMGPPPTTTMMPQAYAIPSTLTTNPPPTGGSVSIPLDQMRLTSYASQASPRGGQPCGGQCFQGSVPQSNVSINFGAYQQQQPQNPAPKPSPSYSTRDVATHGQSERSQVCSCGNIFMEDSNFCRKCGAPRPTPAAAAALVVSAPVVVAPVVRAPPVVLQRQQSVTIQQAKADAMFDQLDKNHDGVITRDEFEAAPSVNAYSYPPPRNDFQYEADTFQPGEILQCTCGNIFMDDSKFCRKCGADRKIAEALIVIERDESLFIEELNKLPGGAEALAALRGSDVGGLPNGPAKEAAMRKIKDMIDNARRQAKEKAARAMKKANDIKAEARDAKILADKADNETKDNELEHQYLTDLANKAKEDEATADREARRLRDLADQAARDADAAKGAWEEANNHAQHHSNHAGQMSLRLEDAKRLAAQQGLPTNPHELGLQVRMLQNDATKKAQDARKAQELAAKAEERAREQMALAARLEGACQPGGQFEELLRVQQQVNSSSRAKSIAIHARKKADALAAQLAQLAKDAEYAEQMARKAEQEAQDDANRTAQLMQQSRAAQDALNLHITSAGAGGQGPQLTPEAARQAIQDAKDAAAQARADAIKWGNKAAQDGQAAQAAQNKASQTEQIMQALPNVDGLDEDTDKARLLAEQAKAHADALAAAAAAAAKHAQGCHQRASRAEGQLADQTQRAKQLGDKEREAWQKRFGEGSVPRNRGYPGGAGQYPTEAAREEVSAEKMMRDAAKAEEEAAKAEAQAKRLDELMQALERARMFEEQLRPSMCECGNVFKEDSNFCRICGRPRMQGWTWEGYDKSMAQVRQQAKSAAADVEARAVRAEATQLPVDNSMYSYEYEAPAAKVVSVPEVIEWQGPASSNESYSITQSVEPEMYFTMFR